MKLVSRMSTLYNILYLLAYIMYIVESNGKKSSRNTQKQKFNSLFIPAMPWSWIKKLQAPRGGATFMVAHYIWFQKGVKETKKSLVISSSGLNRFYKMDKRTFIRAPHELESLEMITVESQEGKSPKVTIKI